MSELKEFKCDNCGVIPFVHENGYAIRGRILEGITFEIYIDSRKKYYEAHPIKADAEYFSDFNEKKLLKEMADHAEELDIAECPKCHGEVIMPNKIGLVKKGTIKQVPMGNIMDVIKGLDGDEDEDN